MNYYPDQLMPTCIQIEPILPQYRHVIKKLMMKHDGDFDGTTAFFPSGTI